MKDKKSYEELLKENRELTKELSALKLNGTESALQSSSKIKRVIKIDENDKFNTIYEKADYENSVSNFRVFSSVSMAEFFRNKLLWAMCFALPMFIIFTSMLWLSLGEHTLFEGVLNIFLSDAQKIEKDQGYIMSLTKVIVNWSITVPVLITGLIIFSSFLNQSRNDNLLKRFTMVSMSKKQIYSFYMITTGITVFIIFAFFWLIFIPLSSLVTFWIVPGDSWVNGLYLINGSDGIEAVKDFNLFSPYGFMKGMDFHSDSLAAGVVLLVVTSSILGLVINSFGFKTGMKSKSQKQLMSVGLGLWLFSQVASMGTGLLTINLFASYKDTMYFLPEMAGVGRVIIFSLAYILKYMSFFTIPSLMNLMMFLTVFDPSSGLLHKLIAEDASSLFVDNIKVYLELLVSATVLVGLAYTSWIFYKRESMISYDILR